MQRSGLAVFLTLSALAVSTAAGERLDMRRDAVVEAVEKAAPAVVNISTEKVTRRGFFPDADLFFHEPFRAFPGRERITRSLGSGGIFTTDGYAFTNAHVVNRASRIMVTMRDGTQHEAQLVNVDVAGDIAVIKIAADGPLPTLTFGRSDDLMVGEKAIAVGNPFGLENSVTTGVISAVKRDIAVRDRVLFTDVLQSDALINPGNSGGPLLNIFGEVIGVNSAIRGGAQGISFAIPIDRVKRSLAALLDYRQLRRMKLGLDIETEYVSDGPRTRLVVKGVKEGGSASRAGMKAGDVVVSVGGKGTGSLAHFMAAVLSSDTKAISVRVEREGRPVTLEVEPEVTPKPDAVKLAGVMLGISAQQMDASLAGHVGLEMGHGILVAEVEKSGPAYKQGLRAGDIILQVNDVLAGTMDDFGAVLESLEGAPKATLIIVRGEKRGWVTTVGRYSVEVEIRRR